MAGRLPPLVLLLGLAWNGGAWANPLLIQPIAEVRAGEEGEPEGEGKKAAWLKEKHERRGQRATARPKRGQPPQAVLTLHNLWTFEVLPLSPGVEPQKETWDRFLRCHHTNQFTAMDRRLIGLIRAASQRFASHMGEVVSGFRAPKYNLMLRKKGHQVARDSQHTYGHAIDFRLAGVELKDLRRFVLSQRMGGVGYYPHSQFVHADTGPLRTWTAE